MKHLEVFGEQISTGKPNSKSYFGKNNSGGKFRFYFLYLILIVSGVVLTLRLGYLQIVRAEYYSTLSDNNRTKTNIIYAPRGIIYDRYGKPLVYNIPGFKVIKGNVSNVIDKEKALDLLSKGDKNVVVDSLRQYPYSDATAHVLGYIGQISEDELKKSGSTYTHESWIGKEGIEKKYEDSLRGIDGKELVEVDALGKKVRTLGTSDPVSGQDVKLTLDIDLQNAVYEALKDVKKGAAIVSTPEGQILAMVSKPSFDPNLFTLGESHEATNSAYKSLDEVLGDKQNQPLLNRAISGIYPPGSTFKLVTAAAGLMYNIIDSNYTVEDNGIIRIGPYSFSNWFFTQYGRTDGVVDVVKAISRSNDIFFYKLAQEVGVDKLSDTASNFGVGRILGIDLIGEVAGVLPTKEWKEKNIKDAWYLGDTFIYGIGQGYLLTTPLQVNAWTSVIANGSSLYKPYLDLGKKPQIINKNIIDKESVDLIRQGMIASCSPGGVAFPFFDFKVRNSDLKIDNRNIFEAPESTESAGFKDFRKVTVACKTGTSQWGGEKDDPHAWITLFAPAYDPEIVVTVLVEASGEGSAVAGPIAKKIVESYFGNSN